MPDAILGKGGMGVVVSHFSKTNKVYVARKKLTTYRHFNAELFFLESCKIMREHELSTFVVWVYGGGQVSATEWIIDLELAQIDLHAVAFKKDESSERYFLTKCPQLPTSESVTRVLKDCLCGLLFLHEIVGVAHNDIKPENLLIAYDGIVKIADLGLCSQSETGFSKNIGTLGYAAPELYSDQFDYYDDGSNTYGHRGKSDLFGLGVALYLVFEGNEICTLSQAMCQAAYEREQATEKNLESLDIELRKKATAFYLSTYSPKVIVGRNVQNISRETKTIIAEMCNAYSKDRQTARDYLIMLNGKPIAKEIATQTENKQRCSSETQTQKIQNADCQTSMHTELTELTANVLMDGTVVVNAPTPDRLIDLNDIDELLMSEYMPDCMNDLLETAVNVAGIPPPTPEPQVNIPELMAELAEDAARATDINGLRADIAGSAAKTALLNEMWQHSNATPICGRPLELLELMANFGGNVAKRRQLVFEMLTGYKKNWWKKSDVRKSLVK